MEIKLNEEFNKDIDESLRTMRDVFCSEAEMNGYLEIDQEIQNTEDFSVESKEIDDSTQRIHQFLSNRLN